MRKIIEPGFTGRVGNLIFYNMYGKQYVRTVPDRVKQTKATKASAGVFGLASTMGFVIRSQMASIIAQPKDNNMQTRLVTFLYQWLLNLKDHKDYSKAVQAKSLVGFQFIEQNHSVSDRWKIGLNITIPASGQIEIKIPAFVPTEAIKAPTDTASVICRIATSVSDVEQGFAIRHDSAELVFEYNDKPVASQTINFTIATPKESLVLTGISMEYRIAKRGYQDTNKNKNYMPSEIVDAKWL